MGVRRRDRERREPCWCCSVLRPDQLGKRGVDVLQVGDIPQLAEPLGVRFAEERGSAGWRPLPETAVPEDPLQDILLAGLDEAHDLHGVVAASRAAKWIDLVVMMGLQS